MKRIYIDLGCFDGDTVNQFKNWRKLLSESAWDMYAFDPNTKFAGRWSLITDCKFEAKAAWIKDGVIEFSKMKGKHEYGSTVMREKNTWNKGNIIKVPCFDFSKWLERFRDDYVILKVDIEGAELPVLTKMIEDGTDDIAQLTMVEWHDGKMKQYKSNKDWIWKNYRGRLVEWR